LRPQIDLGPVSGLASPAWPPPEQHKFTILAGHQRRQDRCSKAGIVDLTFSGGVVSALFGQAAPTSTPSNMTICDGASRTRAPQTGTNVAGAEIVKVRISPVISSPDCLNKPICIGLLLFPLRLP